MTSERASPIGPRRSTSRGSGRGASMSCMARHQRSKARRASPCRPALTRPVTSRRWICSSYGSTASRRAKMPSASGPRPARSWRLASRRIDRPQAARTSSRRPSAHSSISSAKASAASQPLDVLQHLAGPPGLTALEQLRPRARPRAAASRRRPRPPRSSAAVHPRSATMYRSGGHAFAGSSTARTVASSTDSRCPVRAGSSSGQSRSQSRSRVTTRPRCAGEDLDQGPGLLGPPGGKRHLVAIHRAP